EGEHQGRKDGRYGPPWDHDPHLLPPSCGGRAGAAWGHREPGPAVLEQVRVPETILPRPRPGGKGGWSGGSWGRVPRSPCSTTARRTPAFPRAWGSFLVMETASRSGRQPVPCERAPPPAFPRQSSRKSCSRLTKPMAGCHWGGGSKDHSRLTLACGWSREK